MCGLLAGLKIGHYKRLGPTVANEGGAPAADNLKRWATEEAVSVEILRFAQGDKFLGRCLLATISARSFLSFHLRRECFQRELVVQTFLVARRSSASGCDRFLPEARA